MRKRCWHRLYLWSLLILISSCSFIYISLKVVEINQKTLAQCQNMSANCFNNSDENPVSCPMTTSSSISRDPNIQTYSTAVPREFKDIDEFTL